jgi:pimeloyl-ACP methyl ester carboxylesterase
MRCPECARQTTQVKRMPAGIGGGRAPATYVLIAINVAAFVVEIIGGGVGAGIASSGGKVFNHFALFGPQIADGDYWRLLTELTLPVLLIQGDGDRLAHVEGARRVAGDNPHWTYVELPDVGHTPQLEVPDDTARLVSGWLRDSVRAGA